MENTPEENIFNKRLLAFCIDIIIAFILFLIIYSLAIKPLLYHYMQFDHHMELYSSYISQYNDLCFEYGIISYGENSEIIYNNVSNEVWQAFNQDQRVIDTIALRDNEFYTAFFCRILTFIVSMLISLGITNLIIPIILRGRTTGMIALKIETIRKNGEKAPYWLTALHFLFFYIFSIFLGVCTLGISALLEILFGLFNKNHMTISDLVSQTIVIQHSKN